jgi:hypothetical protein
VTQRSRLKLKFTRRPKPDKVGVAGLNHVRYSLLSKTDKKNHDLDFDFEAFNIS